MGSVKQSTGSYAAGWVVLAVLSLGTLFVLGMLVALRSGWRTSWVISEEVRTEGADALPAAAREVAEL